MNLAPDVCAAAAAAATKCDDRLVFISDMLDLSSDKLEVSSCVLILLDVLLCLLLDEISLEDTEWCITCLITIQIRLGQTIWAQFNMSRRWPWLDKTVRLDMVSTNRTRRKPALDCVFSCSITTGNFKKPSPPAFNALRRARQRASLCCVFFLRCCPGVDAFRVGSLFQSTMSKSARKEEEERDNSVPPVLMDDASWTAGICLAGWDQPKEPVIHFRVQETGIIILAQ